MISQQSNYSLGFPYQRPRNVTKLFVGGDPEGHGYINEQQTHGYYDNQNRHLNASYAEDDSLYSEDDLDDEELDILIRTEESESSSDNGKRHIPMYGRHGALIKRQQGTRTVSQNPNRRGRYDKRAEQRQYSSNGRPAGYIKRSQSAGNYDRRDTRQSGTRYGGSEDEDYEDSYYQTNNGYYGGTMVGGGSRGTEQRGSRSSRMQNGGQQHQIIRTTTTQDGFTVPRRVQNRTSRIGETRNRIPKVWLYHTLPYTYQKYGFTYVKNTNIVFLLI